jgi:signal peptidase II
MSTQSPAGRLRAELAVMGLTAAVVLLADQLSKALVAASIGLGEQVRVLGDLLMLWHVRNTGAAFSLFQGGQVFFLVVTLLAFGLIAYFQREFRGRGALLHVVLGMILGGTLGNLIDRFRLGYVTDFISVGIGDLRWPTWNVADASLVVGIGALVVYLTFLDHSPARAEAREQR